MDAFTLKSGKVRDKRNRKFLFIMPDYTVKDVSLLKRMFSEKGEYLIFAKHDKSLRVYFVCKVNRWRHYDIKTFNTRCEFLDESWKELDDIIHFCKHESQSFKEMGTKKNVNRGRRNDLRKAIEDQKNGYNEEEMSRKYKGTWKRWRQFIRAIASDAKMAALPNMAEQ
ncbi:Hypothetical predicted protein [Mytilus galloprovincialis]|uniref:Uncharacterized protein n=1 Tax=Mytilus galloprovincialis TaxID=29158 RepID=A0A8B6E930_MYTGA|nr:Hypothetical predicted protein [Mytilus galloprovincialis]